MYLGQYLVLFGLLLTVKTRTLWLISIVYLYEDCRYYYFHFCTYKCTYQLINEHIDIIKYAYILFKYLITTIIVDTMSHKQNSNCSIIIPHGFHCFPCARSKKTLKQHLAKLVTQSSTK